MVKNYTERGILNRVKHEVGFVGYKEGDIVLDSWLGKNQMPYDLDILSIDVDHDDYYIWEALKKYHPKIVILEVNSYRDPVFEELPGKPCPDYNIDPLKSWSASRIGIGCSFYSAIKLGLNKGYIPISFTGNIIFVRRDLVLKLQEISCVISNNSDHYLHLYTPLIMWGNRWYSNTGLILNTAIRDYYIKTGNRLINPRYLKARISKINTKLWND